MQPEFFVNGRLPGLSESEFVYFRSRLFQLFDELVGQSNVDPFLIHAGSASRQFEERQYRSSADDASDHQQPPRFAAIEPFYSLGQVVLAEDTLDRLLDAISFMEVAPLVYGEWDLASIDPHPSVALNFRGPPGTGKTMAAHAVASQLKRKILLSRLSDLESKYHGDGPKNLVGLFESARSENAVLFVDEAESLLSKRFASPGQAAESAINSMRTELLMALDSFDGLIIFASNLPDSYDPAIDSRLLHVDFSLPDIAARRAIWRQHLPSRLPLATDVSIDGLAETEGVSGRDIKTAVVGAALSAARRKLPAVSQDMLVSALLRQTAARIVHQDSTRIGEELPHRLLLPGSSRPDRIMK